jgi:hypothetical protein
MKKYENNIVNDIIVVGQPVQMFVETTKGETLEINSPDGKNWFLIEPVSRIGTSIDIDDYANCKVTKYQYGYGKSTYTPDQGVLVDTYQYEGKLKSLKSNVFYATQQSQDGEADIAMITQSSSTKNIILVSYHDWDQKKDTYDYSMLYSKMYNTSSKKEIIAFEEEYNMVGDHVEENISAIKTTETQSKMTEFSVEISRENDFSEDNCYSFESLHATKSEETKTTSKWQSMEAVRQNGDDWYNEYLWYSFDQQTSSKRLINTMEVYIDSDEENFSVVIEGEFNTWKYSGSGSEKSVEVYAQYHDGNYEQKFKIHEANSKKETTTEVTRSFNGEVYSESVDKVVYDYRKDKETVSGSSFYYTVDDENYDAYGDFLYGVEEYTGHDVFEEIGKFEDESRSLVSSFMNESSTLKWDAADRAIAKGTHEQQYQLESEK